MEQLAEALTRTELAEAMRVSRWGYAAASGGHVLGVALLVGAIVPYDLKLMGLMRRVPAEALSEALRPTAAAGFTLAALCGALLFLADPAGYLAEPVFLAKMALVAAAAGHALRWVRDAPHEASTGARITAGLASAVLWIAALALGRLIAFVD